MWSRVSAGSTTVVGPSAKRPARSTAVLTWALGTGGSKLIARRGRRPSIVIGAVPSGPSRTAAPIAWSGAAMRRIGRRIREASPSSEAVIGCPAMAPASIRIVLPELPQSRRSLGALRARSGPLPSTMARPSPWSRTNTPQPSRHDAVWATSSPGAKPPR